MTNTKTPKLSRNLIGKSGINWSESPEGADGFDFINQRWVSNKFFYDSTSRGYLRVIWRDDDLRTEDTQDMFYTEMTITYANGKKFTVKGLRVDEDVVSVEFSKPKANLEVSKDDRKDWTNDDWILNTGDFKPGTTWGQKSDWLDSKLDYGNTDRVFPRGKIGYNRLIGWLIGDNMRITGNQDVVGVLLETEKAKRKANNKVKVDREEHSEEPSEKPSEKPSTKTTFSGIAVADKLKQGIPLSPEEIQSVLKILMEDNNYI